MIRVSSFHFVAALICSLTFSPAAFAQRLMEKLDRGVVAVHEGEGKVFVSWRHFANEPADIGYNVYRQSGRGTPVKVNAAPLTGPTCLNDAGVNLAEPVTYTVKALSNGRELDAGRGFTLAANAPAQNYIEIPVKLPVVTPPPQPAAPPAAPPGPAQPAPEGRGQQPGPDQPAAQPEGERGGRDGGRGGRGGGRRGGGGGGGGRGGGAPGAYSLGDGTVADLDGDGVYEIIIKGTQQSRDTASAGMTGNTVLQAYKLDGTLLWTVQMGINIREGEHDTQFMVYDLDGDGRAELACRTADGSVDGLGKVIGQAGKDWRVTTQGSRQLGKNMDGPEYMTIFDGLTGKELASAPYVPSLEPRDGWGGIGGSSGNDGGENRGMRFLACVAYLDGVRPSVIMCRGAYGRTVLAAWDWRDGKLTQRWVFDSAKHPRGGAPYITAGASVSAARGLNKVKDYTGNWGDAKKGQAIIWDREGKMEYAMITAVDGDVITVSKDLSPGEWKSAHVAGYSGQGGHSVSVADVDNDGKDEIVYQSMIVDDNGQGYLTTGFRHGDSLHVGDLDPEHPGLEVFCPHENEGYEWDQFTPAATLYSARTGDLLKGFNQGQDQGRGVASDIDPRHPGAEMWGIAGGLYNIKGENIAPRGPQMTNFVIWWDGDELREMVDGNRIAKWNWEAGQQETIFTAEGAAAAAGTKSSPVVTADLFGDWREECVLRVGNNALRIYTTTIPTTRRLPSLMQDPQYRLAVTWQNVTYNQPPHPSFFLGAGMAEPPRPNIRMIGQ